MKTNKASTKVRNGFLGVLVITMLFSFTSPVVKARFAPSSLAPEAQGYVKVKKDDLNNYAIEIHISELAVVSSLKPSHNTYVAWMVTDEYVTKNMGQLKGLANTLSGRLKGTFKSVSILKPAKIFITAEDEANVDRPGTEVVLATNRF